MNKALPDYIYNILKKNYHTEKLKKKNKVMSTPPSTKKNALLRNKTLQPKYLLTNGSPFHSKL